MVGGAASGRSLMALGDGLEGHMLMHMERPRKKTRAGVGDRLTPGVDDVRSHGKRQKVRTGLVSEASEAALQGSGPCHQDQDISSIRSHAMAFGSNLEALTERPAEGNASKRDRAARGLDSSASAMTN